VKGGEDLRIDQRMEQLLDVSNGLLARDAAAAGHGLQARCGALQSVWMSRAS